MLAILGRRSKPKIIKPKMRFSKQSLKIRLNKGFYKFLRTILFLGLIFILLYPVIYIFSTSIKSEADMFDPTTIWVPKEPTIQTYKDAYDAMGYWEGFRNSLMIAGLSMIFQLISCSFIGYGFARLRFKESKFIFAVVLLTMIIPQQIIITPQIMMYKNFDLFGLLKLFGMKQLNLLDSYAPFILPAILGSGIRSGLFIYLFRQFYRGMPKELEDAAYVDGCTPIGAYLRIMFPNAVPVIVSVSLFSFVWHWNDTFGPTMFLTKMSKYPLSLKMVNIVGMITQSSQISDLTYIIPTKYAGIALAIFPLIILYALGQKYFVENLDRSGIVG